MEEEIHLQKTEPLRIAATISSWLKLLVLLQYYKCLRKFYQVYGVKKHQLTDYMEAFVEIPAEHED